MSSEGAAAARASGEPGIRRMEYPRMSAAEGLMDAESRIRTLERERAEREKQFAAELERVRRKTAEEVRQIEQKEDAAWRRKCEAALTGALGEFRSAREEYLARVEHEVVRLALAIAERILRREAQMDPLLLAGAVREALRRLADTTAVRLRVAAGQREMWTEMLRLMPGLPLRPEVTIDERMESCDVALETEVGNVDLGVRAQMGEIERSFFDRAGIGEASAEKAGRKQD